MNSLEQAILIGNGLTGLARLINKTPQTVNNWRFRGVPAEFCPSIERATQGAVRCEDLRPDVDWADRTYRPRQKSRKAKL